MYNMSVTVESNFHNVSFTCHAAFHNQTTGSTHVVQLWTSPTLQIIGDGMAGNGREFQPTIIIVVVIVAAIVLIIAIAIVLWPRLRSRLVKRMENEPQTVKLNGKGQQEMQITNLIES